MQNNDMANTLLYIYTQKITKEIVEPGVLTF